jgi:hypothetical protein
LPFAICLTDNTNGRTAGENRKLAVRPVLFAFIIMAGLNNLPFAYNEYKTYNYSRVTQQEIFDNIGESDAIITDIPHIAGITAYLTDTQSIYRFNLKPFSANISANIKLGLSVFPNIKDISDFDMLKTVQESHPKTWILFESVDDDADEFARYDELARYCAYYGIEYKYIGKYDYERYYKFFAVTM